MAPGANSCGAPLENNEESSILPASRNHSLPLEGLMCSGRSVSEKPMVISDLLTEQAETSIGDRIRTLESGTLLLNGERSGGPG